MNEKVKNLTEGGILKPLLNLAFPIMAAGFIQMAYSLTDMAWVGRLGSEAVAVVGSVGILTWLTSSIALLPKIGAEVSVAQFIGSRDLPAARMYASHTTTIAFIVGVSAGIILFFGADFIVSFFELKEDVSYRAARYLQIISFSIPISYLVYNFFGIYNAAGRSRIPFYLISSGLICNMLLDPLLIFGVFGLKGMGTEGAAYATCISQLLVLTLFVIQTRSKNGILDRFPYFVRLRSEPTKRILKLGLPVALMNILFAFINMFLARVASIHGGHIGGQIEGITWNTSQGFASALGAFVAQNYGARKPDRTRKAYRYTLTIMSGLGMIVTVVFLLFGKEIFGIFIPEEEAMLAGGEYLMIVGISQLFMMLELTTQGMFNGFGKTLPPAIVSVTLNAARIPLALYLAPHLGIAGIWWAIAISSILKGIILPAWFAVIYRRETAVLRERKDIA